MQHEASVPAADEPLNITFFSPSAALSLEQNARGCYFGLAIQHLLAYLRRNHVQISCRR